MRDIRAEVAMREVRRHARICCAMFVCAMFYHVADTPIWQVFAGFCALANALVALAWANRLPLKKEVLK